MWTYHFIEKYNKLELNADKEKLLRVTHQTSDILEEHDNQSFVHTNENSTILKNSIYENDDYYTPDRSRSYSDGSISNEDEGEDTRSIQTNSFLTYY